MKNGFNIIAYAKIKMPCFLNFVPGNNSDVKVIICTIDFDNCIVSSVLKLTW